MCLHLKNYRYVIFSFLLISILILSACNDSPKGSDEPIDQESVATVSTAENIANDNPFNTGLNSLLEGDAPAALTTFERMLEADGDDVLYGEVGIAAVQTVSDEGETTPADLQNLLRKIEGSALPLAEALIYDSLGTIYIQQAAYEDAADSLRTALALSEGANNPLWNASLARKIGETYTMQHINGLAYDYTLQAYNLYLIEGNTTNQVRSLIQLGQVYNQLGLLEDALSSYVEAEEMASTIGDTPLLASLLMGKGDIKAAQGQSNEATAHYTEALTLVKGEDSMIEGTILLKLGNMQAQTGEIEPALTNYQASEAIFELQGNLVMLAAVEEALAYLPTGEFNVNLVLNPGNEAALVNNLIPEWTVEAGLTNWRRGQEVEAAEGEVHFFVGAASEEIAELCQQIDVSEYALYIDGAKQKFELSLYIQVYPPSLFSSADASQYLLEYYGELEEELLDLFSSPEYQPVGHWEQITQTFAPPVGTRAIRLCLRSIKYGGLDSDGYFDGLSLIALPPE